MEEIFEPVTENQEQSQNQIKLESEKQKQALRDSTRTTTQAIQDQTRAIQKSSNALNKNLQTSFKEGIEKYDETTNSNNQVLTNLVNSKQVDSCIVKAVSKLLLDKNKGQFSLKPVEGNPNLFTINPNNTQLVLNKGSTLTYQNGKIYKINDPDLSNFINNAQLDTQPQYLYLLIKFLNDMKYNIMYGDKNSEILLQ